MAPIHQTASSPFWRARQTAAATSPLRPVKDLIGAITILALGLHQSRAPQRERERVPVVRSNPFRAQLSCSAVRKNEKKEKKTKNESTRGKQWHLERVTCFAAALKRAPLTNVIVARRVRFTKGCTKQQSRTVSFQRGKKKLKERDDNTQLARREARLDENGSARYPLRIDREACKA